MTNGTSEEWHVFDTFSRVREIYHLLPVNTGLSFFISKMAIAMSIELLNTK